MIFETISKTFQTNSVNLNNMSLSGLFNLPKKSIDKGDLETNNTNNNKGGVYIYKISKKKKNNFSNI